MRKRSKGVLVSKAMRIIIKLTRLTSNPNNRLINKVKYKYLKRIFKFFIYIRDSPTIPIICTIRNSTAIYNSTTICNSTAIRNSIP